MSKTIKGKYESPVVRYCVVPDLPTARRSLCLLKIPCQDCLVLIQQKGGEEFFEQGLAPVQQKIPLFLISIQSLLITSRKNNNYFFK